MSTLTAETSTAKVFDILNGYEDVIVESFRDYNTVSVIAPSATGKSLLIPLYLAKAGNRVLVATITNNAAKSLAQFFSVLVPSVTCSYLDAKEEVKYGSRDQTYQESRIVYSSVGNVRRLLEIQFIDGKPQNYPDYNVIMLDEIHTGTVDQTICLGLWRNAISSVMFPRLLMTTATPVKYMSKVTPSYKEFDLRSETTTPYPIERRYIPVQTGGLDLYNKRKAIYRAVTEQVVFTHANTPVNSGHIIVFLDTKDAVQEVGNSIVNMIGALNLQDRGAAVLKVYGKMDPDTSRDLYANTWSTDGSGLVTDGIRKIIISTNVLESSVTIPYIGHVFDSMLRIRRLESSTGRMVPTLVYASQNSALQAAGRTGRTNPGVNYILLSEEEFRNLPGEDPSELSVSPIGREIIELLIKRLVPSEVLFNIPISRIEAVSRELEVLGIIQEGTRNVTESGNFCAYFDTLTLRNSLVMYNFWIMSANRNNLYFEIVLSSILDIDVSRLFKYPYRGVNYKITLKEHERKYWGDVIGKTQVETLLNLWNKVGTLTDGEGLRPKERTIRKDACKKLSVRPHIFEQIVKTVDSSIRLLGRFPEISIIYPQYRQKRISYLGVDLTPEDISMLMQKTIKVVSSVYKDSILSNHFLHYKDRTPIPNAYYKFGKKGVKGSGISYVVLNDTVPGPLSDYNEIVVLSKIPYETRRKGGVKYNYGIILHLPTPNSMKMQDVAILSKLRSQAEEQDKIESISYQFEGLLPSMVPAETFESQPLPRLLDDGEEKVELKDVPPNILIPRRNRVEIEAIGKRILERSVIKILQLPQDSILVPRATLVGDIQLKL